MAWLGAVLGEPSDFLTVHSPGGSDRSPVCFYHEEAGRSIVGVGSGGAGYSINVYIYRNGSLLHSATDLQPGEGGVYWRPRFFMVGGYVFYPAFSGSYVEVRKLNLSTGTYTTPFSEDTSQSGTGYVSLDVAYDPENKYMYVATNYYGPSSYQRIWQLNSDGTKNHRLVNLNDFKNRFSMGINPDDGFVYFGAYEGGGAYSYLKIATSAEDGSFTTVSTPTHIPIVGVYGLHFRNTGSYILYTADDSADNWDLSSYLNNEYRMTVLRKDSGSDTFYILCANGNTLYFLKLSPGSTVTELDSITIDSDHNPVWPSGTTENHVFIGQAQNMALNQDPLSSGQGTDKRMIIYKPPDRDVI